VFSNPIWRLRMIGMAEGASYIALLGIAMPLKYMANMPLAVRIAGSIHGALFVIFVVALMQAWTDRSWKLGFGARVFVAALLPFGPFVIDGRLKKQQDPEPQQA
jgi:integral membrane protein